MQIITDRRALHAIPELDLDLPETMAYLQTALAPLSCRVFSPSQSALCAFFDFGRGDTIAFRSDADALPIPECTGLPFASRHTGRMHACGHDGHMAMLLELARRIDRHTSLAHNILLVFQPAEETIGGAKLICESGVFSSCRVRAIFGMHLWPGLAEGVVASRAGEMMSRSCEITVQIKGRSSHIAKREAGIDALAAGVDFYRRIQNLEQGFPPAVHRLLSFGRMESGEVRNAVSGKTILYGTLRAFQDEVYYALRRGAQEAAAQTDAAFATQTDIHFSEGYPPVINPSALYHCAASAAEFSVLEHPVMISEDFSWYQQTLPGMFFFLGTGNTPALHADTFDFHEEILLKGADFWETLAENFDTSRLM
jgi:amidohydrolase